MYSLQTSLQNYHFITSTRFFALYFYYAFYSATYYFFYISHHHPLFCPTLLRFYFALYVLRLYLLNLINSIRHLADTYIAFSHMIASASISFELPRLSPDLSSGLASRSLFTRDGNTIRLPCAVSSS